MLPPVTDLMTNDELDTWADIYAQARVAELVNVTFSEFLQAPFTYLANAGQETALDCLITGYRPLLPKQVQAAQRIQQDWADTDTAAQPKQRGHLTLVASR